MKLVELNESDFGQLHCQYASQTHPQPVHVEIDPEAETLSIDYTGEVGPPYAVPMDVYHGRRLWYSLPIVPTAEAANRLLRRLAPLAERVIAGYSCEWNGSNHVGRLSDDAATASSEIHILCGSDAYDGYLDEDDTVQVWEGEDWLSGADPTEIGLTPESTEADIERIANRLQTEAEAEGILVEDMEAGVRHLLESLREEAM